MQSLRLIAHRGAAAERPENTLAAYRRAIEVGADVFEVDARLTRDGRLVSMHDATVDRTTNGRGRVDDLTFAEIRALDAGDGERVPTLAEAAALARGKIDLLVDLKGTGRAYAEAVVSEIRRSGEPSRTLLGIRGVAQARLWRELLPEARQLGLIPQPEDLEAFVAAGVEIIRLWPRWLTDETLLPRLRATGAKLHLNGKTGEPDEMRALLPFDPDSLCVDDPARLLAMLAEFAAAAPEFDYLAEAIRPRSLQTDLWRVRPSFKRWQSERRRLFLRRLAYRYTGHPRIVRVGATAAGDRFRQDECGVFLDGRRLFRFFRLLPEAGDESRLPTIVCFMGHGTAAQLLTEADSYQHAAAAQFAAAGYRVYVMENAGMAPGADTHLTLDRLLRLDGCSWYGLLFAHQRLLLDHVFADPQVDGRRVGVAGVSTGGLLALTAAALEPRIAAASVQGIFGSMRVSFIADRERHCDCGAIPGLLPQFDLPDLALLVAPRALHISNAQSDTFPPAEAERCLAMVRPAFEALGGPAPVFTSPPGGHEFAVEAALAFFAPALGTEATS